jgi:group I intron endonuclease
MMNKFHLYLVRCKMTGKGYVGITSCTVERRWRGHLKLSLRSTRPLYSAIREYGVDAFTVSKIGHAETWAEIYEKERAAILQYRTHHDYGGYNIQRGGGPMRDEPQLRSRKENKQRKQKPRLWRVSKRNREELIFYWDQLKAKGKLLDDGPEALRKYLALGLRPKLAARVADRAARQQHFAQHGLRGVPS